MPSYESGICLRHPEKGAAKLSLLVQMLPRVMRHKRRSQPAQAPIENNLMGGGFYEGEDAAADFGAEQVTQVEADVVEF